MFQMKLWEKVLDFFFFFKVVIERDKPKVMNSGINPNVTSGILLTSCPLSLLIKDHAVGLGDPKPYYYFKKLIESIYCIPIISSRKHVCVCIL